MSDQANDQLPSPEIRRKILEGKRDQYQAAGFEAELDIATFKVQKVPAHEEREKASKIEEKRLVAENCYASAKELGRLLSELPGPEGSEP